MLIEARVALDWLRALGRCDHNRQLNLLAEIDADEPGDRGRAEAIG